MDEQYKEVRFDKYCETCEHKDIKDTDDPCNECLGHAVNLYSEKPVNYSKQKVKNNKT